MSLFKPKSHWLLSIGALQAVFALAAGGSQPNSPEGSNCSFHCGEVPDDSRVLYQWSRGQGLREEISQKSLSVLAWNLYKGRKDVFPSDWQRLSQSHDVFIHSELAMNEDVLPVVSQKEPLFWTLAANYLMKDGLPTGVGIGFDVIPVSWGFQRSPDKEPFVKSPKPITWTVYSIAGSSQKLLVAGIHGINWAGNKALERQIEPFVPVLQSHDGPVIFAGDFNTKNKTRFNYLVSALARAGLERVSFSGETKKINLNHAFVRGVEVSEAVIRNDIQGSDHKPLSFRVELP